MRERVIPSLLDEGSEERGQRQCPLLRNSKFFDFEMTCFGVFRGAKFNTLVTTKILQR